MGGRWWGCRVRSGCEIAIEVVVRIWVTEEEEVKGVGSMSKKLGSSTKKSKGEHLQLSDVLQAQAAHELPAFTTDRPALLHVARGINNTHPIATPP